MNDSFVCRFSGLVPSPLLRSTMEVLQAEASSPALSSLCSSAPRQHGLPLLNCRITNTRIWELNLRMLQIGIRQKTQAPGRIEALPFSHQDKHSDLLHDDDVDAVHRHEEQRLPPGQQGTEESSFQSEETGSAFVFFILAKPKMRIEF